MNRIIFYLLICIVFFSCQQKEKKALETTVRDSVITKIDSVSPQKINLDSFHIFDLYPMEDGDEDRIFISLSDIYKDSVTVPPEIIANQKSLSFEQLKHIELPPQYRKKLLSGTNLSENDSLYLFNYKDNRLERFPIKDLKAVANLNLYTSEGEPVQDYYYMIGFELNGIFDRQKSTEMSNFSMAYFGKENPFAGQKLQPVKWQHASLEEFPLKVKPSNLKPGKTYKFSNGKLKCFLMDLMLGTEITERRLVTTENGKVTFEKTYTLGEGSGFYPLNFVERDEYNQNQWFGQLFKDKPPVIFGFVSESFGCTAITFLDQSYPDFYSDCDNRH